MRTLSPRPGAAPFLKKSVHYSRLVAVSYADPWNSQHQPPPPPPPQEEILSYLHQDADAQASLLVYASLVSTRTRFAEGLAQELAAAESAYVCGRYMCVCQCSTGECEQDV